MKIFSNLKKKKIGGKGMGQGLRHLKREKTLSSVSRIHKVFKDYDPIVLMFFFL